MAEQVDKIMEHIEKIRDLQNQEQGEIDWQEYMSDPAELEAFREYMSKHTAKD